MVDGEVLERIYRERLDELLEQMEPLDAQPT